MILPTNEQCQNIIEELLPLGEGDLTEWEYEFVSSNEDRREFSPAQKEVLHRIAQKLTLDSFQP